MTAIRRLIAAATLITATALSPGLAAADGRHEQEERRDPRGWQAHDERRGPEGAWRERGRFERQERIRQVRHELRELDRERAEARYRLAGRPWRLANLESALLARRDRLRLELDQLSWYAWR